MAALVVLAAGDFVGIYLDPGAAPLLDVDDLGKVNAVRVIDVAVGVAHGDDLAAELHALFSGVGGDVAAAGDNDDLAGKAVVLHAAHGLLREVAQAVAGGLGPGEGAAEGDALAGYGAALKGTHDPLVLTEEITDLARADADVACGDIDKLTDVPIELSHEALAEAHDLAVGLALGVKVRAALAAAHGQSCEAVFQSLLKAEELYDRGRDRGVETQTALIGADRAVELDAETAVHLDLAAVIHPGDSKLNETFRLNKTLDNAVFLVLRVLLDNALEAFQDLHDRLMELRLAGVAGQHSIIYSLQVLVCQHLPYLTLNRNSLYNLPITTLILNDFLLYFKRQRQIGGYFSVSGRTSYKTALKGGI